MSQYFNIGILYKNVFRNIFIRKKCLTLPKQKIIIMGATVLNDAQIDLLNMLHWVNSPETLADLKQVISDYFAKKAKQEMDAMWARGEMTQKKFDGFEHLHERTPYRR